MDRYRFVFEQVRVPGKELQLQEIILRSANGTELLVDKALNPGSLELLIGRFAFST